MKRVICVKPWTYVTVGKVYDVLKNTTDSICEIVADNGSTIYCGAFDSEESHFRPYVEPSKQSVTIEVPDGYKIKSQKIVDNQIVVELEPELNLVVVNTSDTVLTVKPEYLSKLKALGVYDKWLANVKSDKHDIYPMDTMYEKSADFYLFINNSFSWSLTPEKYNYWADISHK